MNYGVWQKSKSAAHFQRSDLISRRGVDEYCSSNSRVDTNEKLRQFVGEVVLDFILALEKKCRAYLERVVPLNAANQAKTKRIICSDNTVHCNMGHLVGKTEVMNGKCDSQNALYNYANKLNCIFKGKYIRFWAESTTCSQCWQSYSSVSLHKKINFFLPCGHEMYVVK